MGTSGNPAKKAAAKKKKIEQSEQVQSNGAATVSDVTAFKQRAQGQLKTLPSGLTAKLKRVELQTLIMGGSVHNPLMAIVSEAIEKGQGVDMAKMTGMDEGEIDLDTINDMFEMVNRVCVACFVEPECHPLPLEDEGEELDPNDDEDAERIQALKDDNLLYVDEVDAEDKMFIFQWSMGGTDDVATFREEARTDLDAVAKGKGHKRKTKRTAGAGKR